MLFFFRVLVVSLAAAACVLLAAFDTSGLAGFIRRGSGLPQPGVIGTPYMGWDAWYCCEGSNEVEATIHTQVDALVSTGLAAAGYKYVWLDLGWWFGTRDGSNNMTVSSTNWPSGMAALAAYIHSKGLKAGIYTDAGNSGCGTGFPNAGSQGFYAQDLAQFEAWGYDAIRYDSCGLPGDMKPAYDTLNNAIQSAGVPIIYAVIDGGSSGQSAYGWSFASNYRNTAYRSGGDLCGFSGMVSPGGTPSPAPCTWSGFGGTVTANMGHPGAAGPGHWNDPDMMPIYNCSPGLTAGTNCFTDDESQTLFAAWIIMAAPLLLGMDPGLLSAPHLAILKNAEAISLAGDPLGVQGILVNDTGTIQVWSKVLQGTGNRAATLLNKSTSTASGTITTAMLNLTGTAAFRDVFGGTNLGTVSSYTAPSMPSHSTILLHVTGGTENNATTVQVNVGGGAVAPFVADTNIAGDGTTQSVANTISLTGVTSPAPMAVYQSARVGFQTGSVYTTQTLETYIPNLIVGATYKVRLHFAENWKTAAGQRKFNVKINNTPVLANFDVFAKAGAQFQANIQEFYTVTAQGFVSVDLSPGAADFPMLSGVEVIKQ